MDRGAGQGGIARGKRRRDGVSPTEAWARAVAAGIPDDLYWRLTPPEARALLEALGEVEARRERASALRAGLVAAAIYNAQRAKRSDKVWQPKDFVQEAGEEKSDVQILSPKAMAARLRAWAEAHNKKVRA